MNHTNHHGAGRPGSRRLLGVGVLALSLAAGACDLDLSNPNALSEEDVLNDPNGIIALAVGMQAQYATSTADFARAPALVTDEWGTNSGALTAYQSLLTGESFDKSFAVVEAPWSSAYRVVRTANSLLDNVNDVGLDAGTVTGITALAKTYKAMALGIAAMQYELLPADVRVAQPVPQPRAVVLDTVQALLESARADLAGSPNLSVFESRVLVDGIDLDEVIDAMLARYYLVDGEYARADEAAQRVDLASRSFFTYTGTSVNPIWNIAFNSIYVQPLASFEASAEDGDARVAYWLQEEVPAAGGNPSDTLLVPFDQYAERNAPYAVYLPGEILLIQAEARARGGDLPGARELINQVRTQCGDVETATEPIACLPELPVEALDTQEEALDQIAYERRYELFSQGLRWEDLRRLGYDNAVGAAPWIDWLPIPSQECRVNPAAGCTP